MTVQRYLELTGKHLKTNRFCVYPIRPYIHCPDGYVVSVQASENHYCEPRINHAESYEKVELGFPNQKDDLIMDYAEDPDNPTETVYGFVPIELVEKLIQKHGGIANIPDFDEED